ncbi:MAG: Kojibiose phosphorylase [Desulfotomaculum sp. 46_296]|nr:MAG: Kojibiose phosphorylase [Desulfotomaculum sp. 46_296]
MFNKLSEENWVIGEEGFEQEKRKFWETIFTLGNGYLGSRGVLEESFENGYPGTYLAGIYDRTGGQPFEIVNVPNPLRVEIYINGGRLSANEMKIAEHRRVLDLKKAVLHRRTVFQNDGGRYEYESTRFFSLKDFHAAVMVFSLKPLDCDAEITVKRLIDGTTENAVQAVGDPIKRYSVRDCSFHNPEGAVYLEAKTINSGQSIGLAADLEFSGRGSHPEVKWAVSAGEETVSQECSFKAVKGKNTRSHLLLQSIHPVTKSAA